MTLPQHYLDTIHALRTTYDDVEQNAVIDLQNTISNVRRRRTQNEDMITKVTKEFLSTGIYVADTNAWASYDKPHRKYGQATSIPLTKYIRELAQSTKRPYVRLINSSLYVPKTKKLSILTTPFLFVAKKTEATSWGYTKIPMDEEGVFEITRYKTLYAYYFKGNAGQEWMNTFLNYIREPECRRALGLTAEVTP
jgi:hypothetical protein